MIFIGLKRSGWPAGLVATTCVMLHYGLKMMGCGGGMEEVGGLREDDTTPKTGETCRRRK